MAVERDVIINLDVKSDQAVEGFKEINEEAKNLTEQIADVEDGLRNLSKDMAKGEAEKSFNSLNKIVEKNVLSIQELGAAADNYKNIALAAGKESVIGQKSLKMAAKLEKEMDSVNFQVAQLAEGGKGLNSALQLGTGVVAGYTAFQGVTDLLGVENEELQQTFVKLQAAQSALMGIKELSIALDKKGLLMTSAVSIATKGVTVDTEKSTVAQIRHGIATKVATALQKAYAFAVGTGSKAMKLFRLALISTGIGAIIVGIGLLIANFDVVKNAVGDAIKYLRSMGKVVLFLLGPIGWLIMAWDAYFGTVEEGTSQMVEQSKKLTEEHKKRLKEIEAEKQARIDAADKRIKALNREKFRLEALGKTSAAITIQILEEEQEKTRATLDANVQLIQSAIERYTKEAALRGKSEEEFKAMMKAQGVDLDEAQERANEILKENAWRVEMAGLEITKFKREQAEKQNKNKEKTNDEAEKEEIRHQNELEKILRDQAKKNEQAADQLFKARLTIEQRASRALRQEKVDAFQMEMDDLQKRFDEEKKLIGDNNALLLLLQQEFDLAMGEITKAVNDADKAESDAAFQAKIDKANEAVAYAQASLDLLSAIDDVIREVEGRRLEEIETNRQNESDALNKEHKAALAREGLTANQKIRIDNKFKQKEFENEVAAAKAKDAILEKQFKREKAFKIAQIAINTAASVVQALGSMPPPASFIFAGINATIGIAQAAIVATQKFKGSAGSIAPPSFGSLSSDLGGGGGGGGDESQGSKQNDTTTNTSDLINDSKVVVSQVEINETGATMENQVEVATI